MLRIYGTAPGAGGAYGESEYGESSCAGAVLPLTYFIRLTRDVMLHGHQFWNNWPDVAVVAVWGGIGAIVAIWKFRWEPTEG